MAAQSREGTSIPNTTRIVLPAGQAFVAQRAHLLVTQQRGVSQQLSPGAKIAIAGGAGFGVGIALVAFGGSANDKAKLALASGGVFGAMAAAIALALTR